MASSTKKSIARSLPEFAAATLLSLGVLTACSTDNSGDNASQSNPNSAASATNSATNDSGSTSAAADESSAAPAGTTGEKKVEVTADPTENLMEGAKVKVKVAGLDPEKGYYGAICAKEKKGKKPVPDCTGERGKKGGQQWISNKPGATVPLAKNGEASFELMATHKGKGVDCQQQTCVVKIFGDHTEGFEDVAEQPVTFAK